MNTNIPSKTNAATPTKAPVPSRTKVLRELKSVALVTLYFAACFLVLMLCKHLILAEYGIEFRGLSYALVGALIIAKVVLILQHVPLGQWVRRRPVAVDVAMRTLLYTVGVAVVLLLESAFRTWNEQGGFVAAMRHILQTRDVNQMLAKTIAVGGSLLAFNVMAALTEHIGVRNLANLFFGARRQRA